MRLLILLPILIAAVEAMTQTPQAELLVVRTDGGVHSILTTSATPNTSSFCWGISSNLFLSWAGSMDSLWSSGIIR